MGLTDRDSNDNGYHVFCVYFVPGKAKTYLNLFFDNEEMAAPHS